MAKKEFFSSFEKNLSFDNGTATNGHAAVAEPAPKDPVVSTTLKVEKESAPAKKPAVSTTMIKKVEQKETAPLTKVTTFRINVDLLEQIKAIAYWEREKIQDVLDTALQNYVKSVPTKELEKAVKAFKKAN